VCRSAASRRISPPRAADWIPDLLHQQIAGDEASPQQRAGHDPEHFGQSEECDRLLYRCNLPAQSEIRGVHGLDHRGRQTHVPADELAHAREIGLFALHLLSERGKDRRARRQFGLQQLFGGSHRHILKGVAYDIGHCGRELRRNWSG